MSVSKENNKKIDESVKIEVYEMSPSSLVTTFDNPFDPYEDFDSWNKWDEDHNYYTWDIITSFAEIDLHDTDEVIEEKFQNAMLKLLESDKIGIYHLV